MLLNNNLRKAVKISKRVIFRALFDYSKICYIKCYRSCFLQSITQGRP